MNDTLQISLINNHSSTAFGDILLGKILLGCLLFSLSIFTVFGNLLVLYAIRTEKSLRTVSNLFILSLAFADLIVGLFVMPLSAATIILGRWPFSSILCQMWLSIDYVASTASIFNLVLLSLDRYWAVVHPLYYLKNRTRKRANNFIIIIWLISSLWAPAIIFWSHIIPEHSDYIKPTECDTSFRLNKIFKTVSALINFYFPLFTMIIISCRIMIAIRSRSTMEFGRRISSSTRKKMRNERTFTTTSLLRHDNHINERKYSTHFSSDVTDIQRIPITIAVNPFDKNILSNQFDENSDISFQNATDDNDSLWQFQAPTSHSNNKKHFRFSHIKPITILFPSLSSIKENNKRQSEDLPSKSSHNRILKNSSSVSENMKYSYKQSISLNNHVTSPTLDESPHTMFVNPLEQQISTPTEQMTFQTTTTTSISPSPSHIETTTIISTNSHLDIPSLPINNSNKMNILTLVDYIINPSLSTSLQKELKAARQLGMLVGVFTITWLPYFILFLVVAWCQHCVSENIYTASIWLGYLNSTFNPLIYPLCNKHFRYAFKKTFYCHHAKTKLPNLYALRELHALRSIRHRR